LPVQLLQRVRVACWWQALRLDAVCLRLLWELIYPMLFWELRGRTSFWKRHGQALLWACVQACSNRFVFLPPVGYRCAVSYRRV
jgi:hypothetical protein